MIPTADPAIESGSDIVLTIVVSEDRILQKVKSEKREIP
jgi:hypothetical protein